MLHIGPPRARFSRRRCTAEPLERRRLLSAGTLDPFFGDGGFSVLHPTSGSSGSIAAAVASLPDGRSYVAYPAAGGFGIARLTLDGTLDASFGAAGRASTNVTPNPRTVAAIAVQADGKVVVGGELSGDDVTDFGIARFNPDGSLDESFGPGGVVVTDVGSYGGSPGRGSDRLAALLPQPDGKLVAVGATTDGSRRGAAVARYNADGSLDPGFGTGGRVVMDLSTEPPGSRGGFYDGLVLSDGKLLLAAGATFESTGGVRRAMLVRFNPDGTLDNGFGAGGVTTDTTGYIVADAIVPAPGGRSYVYLRHDDGAAVSRWNADGTVDRSFGVNGTVPLVADAGAGDIVVQADGSVLISHTYDHVVNSLAFGGWGLAAFSPSGQNLFTVLREGGSQLTAGSFVALQPDGRALIVGGGEERADAPTPRGSLAIRYRTMPDAPKGARLEGDIIYVTGDASANTLSISSDGQNWSITLDGATQTFPAASARRVDARLLAGNDDVTVADGTPPPMIDLGAGNDTAHLIGNAARIFGDAGDDTFEFPARAGGGAVVGVPVDGGEGDDVVVLPGTAGIDDFFLAGRTLEGPGRRALVDDTVERVTVRAGGGDDRVRVEAPPIPVPDAIPVAAPGPLATIEGEAGNDTVTAVRGPFRALQTFFGGEGDDRLDATTAIDTRLGFDGGAGNDLAHVTGTAADGVERFELADTHLRVAGGMTLTPLNPASLELLEVDGGNSGDSMSVQRTSPGVPTRFIGGAGADMLFSIGPGNVGGLAGVEFNAGGDAGDLVSLFDVASTRQVYLIGGGVVTRNGAATLRYSGLDKFALDVADAGSEITATDGAGLVELKLVGGRGEDDIRVTGDAAAGLGMDAGAQVLLAGGDGSTDNADTFRVRPDPVAEFFVNGSGTGGTALGGYSNTDPHDRLEVDFAAAGPGARYTFIARGRGRYDTRRRIEFGEIDELNDLPAPASAVPVGFQLEPAHALRFAFSADFGSSVTADDLVLTNLTTGERVPANRLRLGFPGANVVVFTFPGYPGERLPDGNYRAVLPAGSVSAGGTPMAADYVIEFWFLAGDVNRDRVVNGSDFAILAGNFGRSGRTYAQGDLNGDTVVNGSDFAILAGNFGKTLPPPPEAAAAFASDTALPSASAAPAVPARQPPKRHVTPAKRATTGTLRASRPLPRVRRIV